MSGLNELISFQSALRAGSIRMCDDSAMESRSLFSMQSHIEGMSSSGILSMTIVVGWREGDTYGRLHALHPHRHDRYDQVLEG